MKSRLPQWNTSELHTDPCDIVGTTKDTPTHRKPSNTLNIPQHPQIPQCAPQHPLTTLDNPQQPWAVAGRQGLSREVTNHQKPSKTLKNPQKPVKNPQKPSKPVKNPHKPSQTLTNPQKPSKTLKGPQGSPTPPAGHQRPAPALTIHRASRKHAWYVANVRVLQNVFTLPPPRATAISCEASGLVQDLLCCAPALGG